MDQWTQLRKTPNNIERQTLQWNPQGKTGRKTWRRTDEEEMKKTGRVQPRCTVDSLWFI